jgi:hypothetical protein
LALQKKNFLKLIRETIHKMRFIFLRSLLFIPNYYQFFHTFFLLECEDKCCWRFELLFQSGKNYEFEMKHHFGNIWNDIHPYNLLWETHVNSFLFFLLLLLVGASLRDEEFPKFFLLQMGIVGENLLDNESILWAITERSK